MQVAALGAKLEGGEALAARDAVARAGEAWRRAARRDAGSVASSPPKQRYHP
jgi:hypothetical protein